MSRQLRTPLDRPDPLTLAIEAYSARLPGHGLPFLRPASSLDGRWVVIGLLNRAVATGRPLDDRGVGSMLLTGCRGIGAGHHDRLRIAIEPLLQADCIVPGPARVSSCAPLHADTTTSGDITLFAHGQ